VNNFGFPFWQKRLNFVLEITKPQFVAAACFKFVFFMDLQNPENWQTISGIILNVIGIILEIYRTIKDKQ
jgi:hypothetical protein